jgi:hypothetical protein
MGGRSWPASSSCVRGAGPARADGSWLVDATGPASLFTASSAALGSTPALLGPACPGACSVWMGGSLVGIRGPSDAPAAPGGRGSGLSLLCGCPAKLRGWMDAGAPNGVSIGSVGTSSSKSNWGCFRARDFRRRSHHTSAPRRRRATTPPTCHQLRQQGNSPHRRRWRRWASCCPLHPLRCRHRHRHRPCRRPGRRAARRTRSPGTRTAT